MKRLHYAGNTIILPLLRRGRRLSGRSLWFWKSCRTINNPATRRDALWKGLRASLRGRCEKDFLRTVWRVRLRLLLIFLLKTIPSVHPVEEIERPLAVRSHNESAVCVCYQTTAFQNIGSALCQGGKKCHVPDAHGISNIFYSHAFQQSGVIRSYMVFVHDCLVRCIAHNYHHYIVMNNI